MIQDSFQDKVAKTLRFHTNKMVCSARGVYSNFFTIKADRPIFVVGCSRAGTTLVYKTISQSPEMGTLNRETHDLWSQLNTLESRQWESHALNVDHANPDDRKFITEYFYNKTGLTRFVDKNNQNGLCVEYLNALFPDAIFVYVKRNPGDNIHSLIEGWKRDDEYATWSNNLPVPVAISKGVYNRWCFFLFSGWRDFVNESIQVVCAEQYCAMNNALVNDLSNIQGDRVYELKYEDILTDPVASFKSVFEFCDLSFSDELKGHCKTVLDRPYNAFSAIKSNKWLESGNAVIIRSVLSKTEEVADLMGYDLSDYSGL
ncbi:sulfotransferase [Aestuariirhabdus sp. Z084]|uniref:sulfotransferase family protein n=1 Tax=Aestuariirhabdus haliotis TaxID=2918751 RepID=UPI00201B3C3C|nr:sulfotransferase [Aestuariirhabdus haliotis]MCL6416879.1 sulfotransferase [Aestuariirhabdus haliotis]MCL6420902.1 sulfotransferase [Aestuariirhabdus haliotis]